MTPRLKTAIAILLVLLVLPAGVPACRQVVSRVYPLRYEREIERTAGKHDIDPYLLAAVIYEESKFEPTARSRVGARGLMQIMPETGDWIVGKMGLPGFRPSDLDDPALSIRIGGWYIAYLRKKYGNMDLALAAYNAGDQNVDKWLRRHRGEPVSEVLRSIPFPETRDFVRDVKSTTGQYRSLYPGRLEAVK